MTNIHDIVEEAGLSLLEGPEGLTLTDGAMNVRGDFARMLLRLKPANLSRELLVKAAKIKADGDERPRAVDATAGQGDDSLLLAAAGFDVMLIERNPVIAALLQDALERATQHPELTSIVEHMKLIEGESIELLPHLDFEPDIVLLDPMFPEKSKDAAAKKKLQMLQRLEQPCDDEQALLDAACAARPRKVVIKRPIKGPHLADRKPSYSLSGKAIRYDVIALPR